MKKKIIIGGVIAIFVLSFAYVSYKMLSKDSNIQTSKNVSIGAEKEEKTDIKEHQNNNSNDLDKSDLDKKIPVENGFKTTITGGSNEQEVIDNNILLENSSIPIVDRLEAKRVAENFVQAIVSFDISDKDSTVEKAVKYVTKDKVDEVRSFYKNLGLNQDIKKTVITNLYSEEEENKENNLYLYFYVAVDVDLIDKYDQETKGTGDSYEVKLIKEDGKYKVVEYHIDK